MEQPKYKRVLLKISGEALAGEASRGLDFNVIGQVCDVVKRCVDMGVQVGVVGGGGLGDIAIRYGYYRYQADIMIVTVVLLVALVQILQMVGTRLSKKLDRRITR